MNVNKLAVVFLVALLVSATLVAQTTFAKNSNEKKIGKAISKAIDRATEGKPSTIDMLNISKFNDSSTMVVINKTGGTVTPPPPPPPPPTCIDGWHYNPVTKECVKDVIPTGNTTTLCVVGDFKDGKVMAAMKTAKCNTTVALGDMGYGSDLKLMKSLGFTKCVIGNHDAPENGSPAIYKEALAYCGDHWSMLVANGTTLLLGINTNGKEADTTSWTTSIMGHLSPTVKNVIFMSHKNGHVFPNAHHPAEAVGIYSKIEDAGHANVKIYELSGHNHDMAKAANGLWYIVGSGGAKKYACGTSAEWPFCDNTHSGYLKLTVDNKGNVGDAFYDTSGAKLH